MGQVLPEIHERGEATTQEKQHSAADEEAVSTQAIIGMDMTVNTLSQRLGQATPQPSGPNHAAIDQQNNVKGDQRHVGRDMSTYHIETANFYGLPGKC